ncbi:MAG: DUF2849 domain-containing protein [Bauldia sp.]
MFKAAVAGPKKVLTANRLIDGLVIFVGPDRTWVTDVNDAAILEDGPTLDAAVALGQEGVVGKFLIDPYPVDVTVEDGKPVPVRLRELIRAKGPTVVYGDEERKKLAGAAA